jgi:hypothetical protein
MPIPFLISSMARLHSCSVQYVTVLVSIDETKINLLVPIQERFLVLGSTFIGLTILVSASHLTGCAVLGLV